MNRVSKDERARAMLGRDAVVLRRLRRLLAAVVELGIGDVVVAEGESPGGEPQYSLGVEAVAAALVIGERGVREVAYRNRPRAGDGDLERRAGRRLNDIP